MKWSNCLVEAIKAKIRTKGKAKIYRIGKWSYIWNKKCFPHFYWKVGDKRYKFNARFSDEPLWGQLWYEGEVTEYIQYD